MTAALMRLWDLGSRAMHHDESLHAWFAWNLSIGNGYSHNPMMHGPFQMEGQAVVFALLGDSEFTSRLLYAVAGTVLVALPIFFRDKLGHVGAVFVSGMLALSPTLLYFSRFARNDILMAVWTLGLMICMWRYLDEGKYRYLYLSAGLLALMFATKESAYIVTFIFGLYLVTVFGSGILIRFRESVNENGGSRPRKMFSFFARAWSAFTYILRSGQFSCAGSGREREFLILLVTLTLPLGGALIGLFQNTSLLDWSGIVLINEEWSLGAIGAPIRGGLVVASLVVMVLVWVSWIIGSRLVGGVWFRYALIFYAIFVLLYSTFLTNVGGIASGIWQSLGYWLVQQGEARGSQPLFYYLMITLIYEFFPFLVSLAGMVYYIRRHDKFGKFLVYWAGMTFAFYTIASEKMPWLLVNITLPLIVLAGRYMGEFLCGGEWRRSLSSRGWILVVTTPILLIILWHLALFEPEHLDTSRLVKISGMLMAAILSFYISMRICRRISRPESAVSIFVPIALMLLFLSVRTAWIASYRYGDTPVEMMVYTQTSPDVVRLARYLEQADVGADYSGDISITVDGTHGFHWPWWWYLRHNTRVTYLTYDDGLPDRPPDTTVLVVHSKHDSEIKNVLDEQFIGGNRIKHRWWFPENYKRLTPQGFWSGLVDRNTWRSVMDYLLYRKLDWPLGSEDAHIYFSIDSALGFDSSL